MGPAAKRRKTSAIEEISFDPQARQEYLSGFSKRKQARIRHAQEETAKRDRLQKIEDRKNIREQRKKDLEEHVEQVNALLRKAQRGEEGSDAEAEESDGFEGFGSDDGANGDTSAREDEYVDPDRFTTVTVEPMQAERSDDNSEVDEEAKEGEAKPEDGKSSVSANNTGAGTKRRTWTKEKPSDSRPKKRKKKFRYESKAERNLTNQKQRSKSKAAAKARRNDS